MPEFLERDLKNLDKLLKEKIITPKQYYWWKSVCILIAKENLYTSPTTDNV